MKRQKKNLKKNGDEKEKEKIRSTSENVYPL